MVGLRQSDAWCTDGEDLRTRLLRAPRCMRSQAGWFTLDLGFCGGAAPATVSRGWWSSRSVSDACRTDGSLSFHAFGSLTRGLTEIGRACKR
ncbi:hypothetical protein YC2023_005593 [Brassica napus]